MNTNPGTGKPEFDFAMLEKVTAVIVRNLNKVIDVNYYPVPEVQIQMFFISIITCI